MDGPTTGEPLDTDRDLVVGRGRKRGVEQMWETAEGAGMRRKAQSQAVEDVWWWVGTMSSWMIF